MKQDSYRAELSAVLHALSTIDEKIHIVSDCRSIVNRLCAMQLKVDVNKGEDEDLWDLVETELKRRPNDHIAVTWIKSHVDDLLANQLDTLGIFTKEQIAANEKADELAKQGAASHHSPHQRHAAAADRVVLATLMQRLHAEVWSAFYPIHEDNWEAPDEDADQAAQQAQRCLELAEEELQEQAWEGEMEEDIWQPQPLPKGRMTIEWNTKKIGKRLQEDSNDYTWGLDDTEYDTALRMPSPSHPFDHTPNSKTTVKGRGTSATGLNFDHRTAEALRW